MKPTLSKCPHCESSIDWKVESNADAVDEKIGPSKWFLCRYCKQTIGNGCKEWLDFSEEEKSNYISKAFFTVFIWGLGIGFIMTVISGGELVSLTFIAPAVLGIILYRKKSKLIQLSNERVAARNARI